MPLQAVIFDLDGTLLNTLADLADAVNSALRQNQLPILQTERYRQLVGSGLENLSRLAVSEAAAIQPEAVDQQTVNNVMADMIEFYRENWAAKSCLYPGMARLVADLAASGLQLAVLSNKADRFTRQLVDHFFPEQPFQLVNGQQADWLIKPDPGLALHMCSRMGAAPAASALVGDTGSDMTTAVRGGLLPIGVTWGFRERQELQSSGARWLTGSAEELSGLLNRLMKE